MKGLHTGSELLGLAAHFIERRQAIENIEDSVLDSLGHDWSGVLLKFQDEMSVFLARFVIEVFRETKQQQIAQEVKNRAFDPGIASLGRGDCAFDDLPVFVTDRAIRFEISSINRKTRDRFAHSQHQSLQCEIAK